MTNETTTTAVQIAPRDGMTALQVCANADSIGKLGDMFAQSGFFGAVTASTAKAALVNCFLEGLSPVQYRAKYHTFEDGTTSVKSDYIQREFHRLGGTWKFNEWTAEACDMTFTYNGETLNMRVTIDEFKANGVAIGKSGAMKTNWKKFPREMLKARCMATAIRAICPEALDGMYTQEEVADFANTTKQEVRIEPTAVSASPICDVCEDESTNADVAICPCGKAKGKAWRELTSDTLTTILAVPAEKVPSLTNAHRNAIIDELANRERAESEAGADLVCAH